MTLNVAIIQGRVAQDIEVKQANQTVKAEFTVAVDKNKSKNGQRDANFIRCVAWGNIAEMVGNYFSKGKPIIVQGELNSRSYTNQQGQKVFVTEIIVQSVQFQQAENNNGGNQPSANYSQNNNYRNQGQSQGNGFNQGGFNQGNGFNQGGFNQGNGFNQGGFNQNGFNQ
ncbi:TPA: single-stranded DNA-binding protein [Streptococcus agalactiae]|nr:single-stranded DNA-binding protein [Streptococcus agalactiae]